MGHHQARFPGNIRTHTHTHTHTLTHTSYGFKINGTSLCELYILILSHFGFILCRNSYSSSHSHSKNMSFRTSSLHSFPGESDLYPPLDTEDQYGKKTLPSPSMWRLLKLNTPEWPYALLGTVGAIMAGVETPLFALAISQVLVSFYSPDISYLKQEVRKVALIFSAATIATVFIYVLQHYFFTLTGERLTVRVREKMFTGESLSIMNRACWKLTMLVNQLYM